MTTLTCIGIFLIVWGILALLIGIFKPANIWKLGKIQGFVQIMSEKGFQIFLCVLGVAALAGGVVILL